MKLIGYERAVSYTPPTRLRLAGSVTIESVPAKSRVIAYSRVDMEYVKGTTSNADGSWEIGGLPYGYNGTEFLIVSVDDMGTYNAECADKIQPVV
jgi:hypothetical protein